MPEARNFAVGFGIEGYAARKAEIAGSRFFECETDDVHHGGFAHVLHREGDVFVAVVDVGFRVARRAEHGGPDRA